jgi:hypothetical protein
MNAVLPACLLAGFAAANAKEAQGPIPDGAYVLRIEAPFAKGLPDWLPLRVNLTVQDGQPVQAAATAIHVNNTWYPVDLGGLRLADGRFTGQIAVTFRADDYETAAVAAGAAQPEARKRVNDRYAGLPAQVIAVDCPVGEMAGPAPGKAAWEKDLLNARSTAGGAPVRAWPAPAPDPRQALYAEFQLMRWDDQTTKTEIFDGMTTGGALLLRCAIRDGVAGNWTCLQGPERYAHQFDDLIWRVEEARVTFDAGRLEGGFLLAPTADALAREKQSGDGKGKFARLPERPLRVKLSARLVGGAVVGTAEMAHPAPVMSVVLGTVRSQPFAVHADRTPRTWAFTAEADPALAAAARKESLVPIRPGEPGQRGFWTDSARFGGCDIFIENGRRIVPYDAKKPDMIRLGVSTPIVTEPYEEYRARFMVARAKNPFHCIAAPTFNLPAIPGAARYRFSLGDLSCEAGAPWAAPVALWERLPPGEGKREELLVQGLDGAGKPVGEAASIPLVRNPPFQGPYFKGLPRTCREAALRSARWLRDHPANTAGRIGAGIGPRFGTGGDGQQWYTTYSGVYGGLVLAQLSADAAERAAGLDLAVTIADCWMRTFAGNYLPDTYKGWVFDQWVYGCTWLDLFRLTGDPRHRDLALELARRLAAKQLPSGTWAETDPGNGHVSFDAQTGRPWLKSIQGPSMQQWDPSSTLYFLGRVRKELKTEEFRAAEDKAWHWLAEHSIARFDWRKQGPHASEDHQQPWLTIPDCALHCYNYLALDLPGRPPDWGLMGDLLRWSEDRDVDWRRQTHATAVYPRIIFTGKNRDTQLRLAAAYAHYARHTGDPLHRAKAEALAGAVLVAQNPVSGQIPHWPDIDVAVRAGAGYAGPGSGDGGNRGEYATMALLRLAQLWQTSKHPSP